MKKKVFVGMSGGVDSSVSAALLQKAGFDVVGVFIKVWDPPFLNCTWREDRREAMRAASFLGIPLITLNLEKEYKKEVVDYMLREYKAGRVPNPDVACNAHVKFGSFYKFALSKGASFVATGHYAQIVKKRNGYQILRGKDSNKDQSYFLWNIKQEQLPKVLFPVGGIPKEKVRILAKKFGLPNAERKDSQGLCFLGKVSMKDFLLHFLKEKIGKVLNEKGEMIGEHPGAFFFTLGERHGFHISNPKYKEKPLYVVSKDIKKNTLTVSDTPILNSFATNTLFIKKPHWIGVVPKKGETISLQFRYRGKPIKAKVYFEKGGVKFMLSKKELPVEGQSLVFYRGAEMIGGGIV